MFSCVLVLALCCTLADDGLSANEEQVIRDIVYGSGAGTSSINVIVVIPKPIGELYKRKPTAVLTLLTRIVDGANPKDSVTAAAYAIELAAGPGGGLACVRTFKKDLYDDIDKVWGRTPRQHWLVKIRVAKEAREKPSPTKK